MTLLLASQSSGRAAMLRAAGFEPVWKDWDPSYDRPEAQLT